MWGVLSEKFDNNIFSIIFLFFLHVLTKRQVHLQLFKKLWCSLITKLIARAFLNEPIYQHKAKMYFTNTCTVLQYTYNC